MVEVALELVAETWSDSSPLLWFGGGESVGLQVSCFPVILVLSQIFRHSRCVIPGMRWTTSQERFKESLWDLSNAQLSINMHLLCLSRTMLHRVFLSHYLLKDPTNEMHVGTISEARTDVSQISSD